MNIADILENWRNKDLDDDQLNEVRLGLQHGLNAGQINVYAKPDYDWMQMSEIRQGLEHGLTEKQMKVFLDPSIGYDAMRINRMQLEDVNAVNEHAVSDLHRKRIKNVLLIVILMSVGIAGTWAAFHFNDYLHERFQTLNLELTTDSVDIDYGSDFNPDSYIKNATKADNVDLILPDNIDTKKLGKQTAKYVIRNKLKEKDAELTVNVVDNDTPQIYLSTSTVNLTRGQDTFSCRAYLDHATDNADGDLTDQATCTAADESLDTQTITYSVKDSSGNEGTAELTLNYADPEPVATPTPETIIIYQQSPSSSGSSAAGSTTSSTQQVPSGHGSKTYLFADGYTMDSAYSACVADMNAHGGSCTPISDGNGIYTGYRLDY